MDQLRHKLFDYTESPPPGVWSKVESALDQDLPGISKKLSAFSSPPPPGLWSKIESGLNNSGRPSKVLPLRKLIRIAAAAVILVAVFMTVRLFAPDSDKDQITSVPEPQTTSPAAEPSDKPDTPYGEDPVEKKDPGIAKSFVKTPIQRAANKNAVSAKKTRYTTMSNDDGQTVRLSKKIAPVFDCAGGKMKSISARCKEDIKALQEKIGSSFTSPSADFSGLIDILKSLEGDQ